MFLCLILAGLLAAGTVSAQEYCSEPVAPYCVDEDSDLDTTLQINRCDEDLKDYEEQLSEYEQCISNQLKSLREELENARKALKEADPERD